VINAGTTVTAGGMGSARAPATVANMGAGSAR
jgi:hypothetical protein